MLLEAAGAMGIAVGERELSSFAIYHRDLLVWNSKFNLFSARSDRDIVIKHFIDSLTLLPYIRNDACRVLDIGSGAGFPGIPLKIVLNSLKISLLESSRKKSSFLKHVIRSLGFTDAVVINSRAESLMEDAAYSGYFQVVTSRAAVKLPVLLRMGAFFLAPDGILMAMKGKISDQEQFESAAISYSLGLKYVGSSDLTLPMTGNFRRIIVYKKLSL